MDKARDFVCEQTTEMTPCVRDRKRRYCCAVVNNIIDGFPKLM